MMKGLIYALAAAFVSFAAVTWATQLITDQPGFAFEVAGNDTGPAKERVASLLQERAERERVISEQQRQLDALMSKIGDSGARESEASPGKTPPAQAVENGRILELQEHLATLKTELDQAKASIPDENREAAWTEERAQRESVVSQQQARIHALETALQETDNIKAEADKSSAIHAGERTELTANNAQLWQEVQRLEGVAGTYREQLGDADQKRVREVSRLQAEIDLRDQNIAALSRQLTANQLNARRKQTAASATGPDSVKTATTEVVQAVNTKSAKPVEASPAKPVETVAEKPVSTAPAMPVSTDSTQAASVPAHPTNPVSRVPASSGAFSSTLEDGIDAYRTGNYETAFDIWLQLAEQHESQAQFHVGALYYEGRGVAKDLDKAREWLLQAQQNGDGRAKSMLDRVNSTAGKARTARGNRS